MKKEVFKKNSVVVKEICKDFTSLRPEAKNALGFLRILLGRKNLFSKKTALKNISLEIKQGENIGLIGRNGSGKSTLLRVIANIYSTTSGEIQTEGSLRFLSGFSLGMHRRLTARENIYALGSLYGFSQEDINAKLDEIIEFSELGDVLDEPLYSYSDGMVSRLGFSVVFFLVESENPDIVLIDEAFSGGGDTLFIQKAAKKVEQFIKGGSTVIIASHDLDFVARFCDRVVWIDRGEIKKVGGAKETVTEYWNFLKAKKN